MNNTIWRVAVGLLCLALFSTGAIADDSGYKFTGKVTTLPSSPGWLGDWTVATRTVHVSASTRIIQDDVKLANNVCVEVRGTILPNLSIDATRIQTREAEDCQTAQSGPPPLDFYGSVEILPPGTTLLGQWTVSGKKINVSASTEVDQDRGPVSVGSCVEVTGTANQSGAIDATSIEVRAGKGSCMSAPGMEKADVSFRGTVTAITKGTPSTWTVGGRSVQVNQNTRILPVGNPPEVNDCVDVEGSLSNTVVVASRIQRLGSGVCKPNPGQENAPSLLGLIEKLPTTGLVGTWTVGGQQVSVAADTRLDTDHGPMVVGACVEVRGPVQNQVLMAKLIQTLDASECKSVSAPAGQSPTGQYQLSGTVVSLPTSFPGIAVIENRNVSITANTVLVTTAGALKVGACVTVLGTLQADGSIVASRIEVQSSSGMCIAPKGVVSSGSYSSFAVSPGQIVSIFGRNIGPATEVPLAVLPDNTVASRLANTRVLFNDLPAPVLYLSQGQINAVVPCGLAIGSTVEIEVESNGAWSNTVKLPVVAAWPSIFTQTNSGKGPGAILNVVAGVESLNGPNNPAAPSSSVEVYATGLGATNPACVDGQIIPANGPYPLVTGTVTATIGGVAADVQFAGSAGSFVTGLSQVNVKVPAGVSGPNLPIVLQVKTGSTTASTPDGVTIAVK